jgi:hypothetical protein
MKDDIGSSNPILRFIDDQTTETLKDIKQAAIENQKSIDALKKTLWEASEKIDSLLKQI